MPLRTPSSYRVCPICGNPMRMINGKWVCFTCGYTLLLKIARRKPRLLSGKPVAVKMAISGL